MARLASFIALVLAAVEWYAVWYRKWPTWSNLIERLPAHVGYPLLGALCGVATWWAWHHFEFRR